jgi:fructose-bisphosphate aldolase class I
MTYDEKTIPTQSFPWKLSFSYGRALQAAPLKAWPGNNIDEGQQTFYIRAKENGAACRGEYA